MVIETNDIEVLGIIPARGGSKGIPRKNIRLLAGKPLLAHTVELALQANVINRVIVSTDDSEIAAVSKEYGSEVVQRPAKISGDKASSESALLHVLNYLKKNEGYEPDVVVFLQCTSPLTLPEDINGTVKLLVDEDADSVLAVTKFHHFLWMHNEQGEAVGINHDKSIRLRRQDIKPQYLETGSIYAMRTKGFLKANFRFFGKTLMYEISHERVLEIDDLIDFQIAEAMLYQRNKY